jgi:hypothetical protein
MSLLQSLAQGDGSGVKKVSGSQAPAGGPPGADSYIPVVRLQGAYDGKTVDLTLGLNSAI